MNTTNNTPAPVTLFTAEEIHAGMLRYAEKHYGKSGKMIQKRAGKVATALIKHITAHRDEIAIKAQAALDFELSMKEAHPLVTLIDGVPFDDDL